MFKVLIKIIMAWGPNARIRSAKRVVTCVKCDWRWLLQCLICGKDLHLHVPRMNCVWCH